MVFLYFSVLIFLFFVIQFHQHDCINDLCLYMVFICSYMFSFGFFVFFVFVFLFL